MNKKLAERAKRAIDRFCEAHYWLHQMENHYHESNPFRWSLNAFITTFNTLPELLAKSAGENANKVLSAVNKLKENQLIKNLNDYRNEIVHKEGLIIGSHGQIGLYDGAKMRIGFKLQFDPHLDSDDAILNYLKAGDPLGLMTPDEDNYPVVYRVWKSLRFDADILTICREALMLCSDLMHEYSKIVFSAEYECKENSFTLDCCKSLSKLQYKGYRRESLMKHACPHSS